MSLPGPATEDVRVRLMLRRMQDVGAYLMGGILMESESLLNAARDMQKELQAAIAQAEAETRK